MLRPSTVVTTNAPKPPGAPFRAIPGEGRGRDKPREAESAALVIEDLDEPEELLARLPQLTFEQRAQLISMRFQHEVKSRELENQAAEALRRDERQRAESARAHEGRSLDRLRDHHRKREQPLQFAGIAILVVAATAAAWGATHGQEWARSLLLTIVGAIIGYLFGSRSRAESSSSHRPPSAD